MKNGYAGAALLAVMSLAACGRGEETKGQPSAEERRALDNIAAKQDAEATETFDTSADSLVPPKVPRSTPTEPTQPTQPMPPIRMRPLRHPLPPTTRTPPLLSSVGSASAFAARSG
jgi:hypothetical protein